MKRLLFSLLSLASLILCTDTTLACTCAPSKGAAQELERSTAVFYGKIVEIKRHKQAANLFASVEVVFKVEKSWKGIERRAVSVFTSSQSSACGYGFKQGRTYLVYAYGDAAGRLSTSICSRTRRLKKAREDLRELGKGRDIVEDVPKKAGA